MNPGKCGSPVAGQDGRASLVGSSGGRAACSYAATGGRKHAALAEPMAGDRSPSETVIRIYGIC